MRSLAYIGMTKYREEQDGCRCFLSDSHLLVNAEADLWLARIQPPEKQLFHIVGGPLGKRL